MLFASPLALIALVASVAAARTGTPTSASAPALNPHGADLTSVKLLDANPLTNAQRLARGLPPNRPRFHSARHLAPRASPAADPNPACPVVTGTLRVAGAGVPAGSLVSRAPNAFGEYGVTRDAADALRVQYAACADGAPGDLLGLNGIADHRFLGAITGFDSPAGDLAPGSSAYAYLGGTEQTPPNAPPATVGNSFTSATGIAAGAESAIWRVDGASGAVDARWVDGNGATPVIHVMYFAPEDFLLLTGDVGAFAAAYGGGEEVTLTFVSA
ncbi:hypothetical protein WOLCODRAFT_146826 [Wolfiporia cocos MD-104 SS10]|uniref:Uncharacterized protein n=1 Tax=Wolfiporia cocos (strain MD-104) TaxID=742152 RepID=A0A2H3JSL7_WOLCO|nr:hypothetical protein WOLCODRAFT_146826 [Wolfiporia cocos MD-104 SS10]